MKVLVVDDESDALTECGDALLEAGYIPLCVGSADEALDILHAYSDIKVVVTDIYMPGKTGDELIDEALVYVEQNISFIIMSGYRSSTCCDFPSVRFLQKPIDKDLLIEAVEEAALSTDCGDNQQIGGIWWNKHSPDQHRH